MSFLLATLATAALASQPNFYRTTVEVFKDGIKTSASMVVGKEGQSAGVNSSSEDGMSEGFQATVVPVSGQAGLVGIDLEYHSKTSKQSEQMKTHVVFHLGEDGVVPVGGGTELYVKVQSL